MDQETKEYLDQKLAGFVKKEDIEKLRQEIKANLRQLKEENPTAVLEGIKELKADLERSIDLPFQQWRQDLPAFLGQIRAEILSVLERSSLQMGKNFQLFREEETAQRNLSKEEWATEIDRVAKGIDTFKEEIRTMVKEASSLQEKVKEGYTEMKEELGPMLRFSFADLEKKINTLETRIKALEKMVFH